ncbi:MAG: cell envelope biogenesis protein TolA [Paracoccaceae bacterium]
MEAGLDTGLSKGTIYSGVGHVGLILWVVVGDYFFAHQEPEPIEVAQVSLMSEAEFQALQSSAPAPSETPAPDQPQVAEPEEAPTPPEPEVQPQPAPDPQPAPEPVVETPPEPQPAPDPVPEPDPVPDPVAEPDPLPDPVPQPEDVVVAPEEQPLPSMAASLRPKPKPADRVAPDPVDVPEDQPVSDAPTEATSDEPVDQPEVVEQPQEETAPQESGDVLRTEATEDQTEALGMTASIRPKSRPNRPRPAEEPAAEAASETAASAAAETDDSAVDDALAALDDTPEPAATGGSDTVAPTGPPLNAGEIGDVRSAIGSKWNLGSVSTDTLRTTIVVRVTFDPSGKPTDISLLESDGPSAEATNTAFTAARSAIVRAYREGGIPLPPEKYETWKVLDLVFDPNGMRLR